MEQNAKKKISCGGFMLGEGLVLCEDGKTLSVSGGGGGSVPKPLTFDYMPEGYPTKSVQTTTLMEEQELAFALSNGVYMAQLTSAFEVVEGQTYTVNWDGTEYECVGVSSDENVYVFGNLSIVGMGDDTGEPFAYGYNPGRAFGQFVTLDTAASHTISVKTTAETVTPIDGKYLPKNIATKSEVKNAQTTAKNAQTTAKNAQTTAENAQTTAENAQTTAENAQTTAENKFQLMRQNTVTTTTTIGTVSNSSGSVPVKGLNIAVGSTIKFTADGNISGKAVWDRPAKEISMENDVGGTICRLELELSLDGETYKFTNKTTSSILTGLVIEYEKVIIPKTISQARTEGAWLPPYLIADCLYLTKESTSGSATLYRITVGDNGTLKATEV